MSNQFKKVTIMKKLMICSMMCLMAIAAEAQVLTSQTIRQCYEKAAAQENVSDDGNYLFIYNADFDGDAVKTKYVYRQKRSGKGKLMPAVRHDYQYDDDGLLLSRVAYRWYEGEWLCMGRHDYLLQDDSYMMEYSRWNVFRGRYDNPCEKIVLSLLPNQTVSDIYSYQRSKHSAPYQLTGHYAAIPQSLGMDYYLTLKGR